MRMATGSSVGDSGSLTAEDAEDAEVDAGIQREQGNQTSLQQITSLASKLAACYGRSF